MRNNNWKVDEDLKKRFFALYFWQPVFDGKRNPLVHPIAVSPEHAMDGDFFAVLRTLDQITDEESAVIMNGRTRAQSIEYYGSVQYWHKYLTHSDYDYLRSVGIALPFMGYSVDELVLAGWIKLARK